MKHIILLSLLTVGLNCFGQSVTLPDSNAVWSVYDQKYFVDGDSTFNSIDYKKYFFSPDSLLTNETLFALVREDTITQEVFAISSGDSIEQLIYDFSLNENDTISIYPFTNAFSALTETIRLRIESVDTVTIGSVQRKRLKIVGYDVALPLEEYWIEGIGSTMGPFNSGGSGIGVVDIYYPVLLCFEQNENLVFDNPNFSSCYQAYPTSVNDIALEKSVDVFPNPSSNSCTIKSETEVSSYQVISVSGRLIYEKQVNADTVLVDISNLVEGIYILRLTTEKGLVTKRLIKTAYNKT